MSGKNPLLIPLSFTTPSNIHMWLGKWGTQQFLHAKGSISTSHFKDQSLLSGVYFRQLKIPWFLWAKAGTGIQTIQFVAWLSELSCMIGVEHLAVHHCIQIWLSTRNEIVEEEMPAQDAVENNPFVVISPIIISERGPYNYGSSRIKNNRCTLEQKH